MFGDEPFTAVFTIAAKAASTAYFIAHAAVELEEFTTFYQSDALQPRFATKRHNETRVFAFFSGGAEVSTTSVLFNCSETVFVQWFFLGFSAANNYFRQTSGNFSSKSDVSAYELQSLIISQTPGWIYLAVKGPQSFNVSMSESKNHTLLINNSYNITSYPLEEAILYRAIRVNKTELLAIKSNISVVAFSENPTLYKDVAIDIGINQRPSMLIYNLSGDLSFTPCDQSGSGIAEVTNE